jgi:hypothetical protein
MIDLDDFDPDDKHGYERQLNSLNRDLIARLGEQLHPEWWRKSAACRGTDSSLFFVERGQNSRVVKAVCAQWPVVDAFLDFALEESFRMGTFGGMTERERRAERRRRQVATRVA